MNAARCSLAILCGILAACLVFFCLDTAGQMLQLSWNPFFPAFAAVSITVPVVAGFFVARAVSGLRAGPLNLLIRLPRAIIVVVAAAYLLTWTLGVPAVICAQQKAAVDAYKVERARNNRVWDAHPWIRTSLAFPVLPCVVVSYHEYQVAGLNGWGGWQVHIWYVFGVRQVLERTHWIS